MERWYVVYGDAAPTAYRTELRADGPYDPQGLLGGPDQAAMLAAHEERSQSFEIVAILPENVWQALQWGLCWHERNRADAARV